MLLIEEDGESCATNSQTMSGPPSRQCYRTSRGVYHGCRARNRVERFFNNIKQCRRIATRYDKLAANYLAFFPRRTLPPRMSANGIVQGSFSSRAKSSNMADTISR